MKNTKFNFLFYLLIFSFTLLVSCETCPPATSYGEVDLMPVSKTFIPDIGEKHLVFIDSIGNEHKVRTSRIKTFKIEKVVGTPCQKGYGFFGGYETQDFVSAEAMQLKMNGDSIFNPMTLELGIEVSRELFLEETDTTDLLFDKLTIQFDSTYLSAGLLTSDRNNEIIVDNSLIPISDTSFYGKSFQDIYTTAYDYLPTIFYTKEQGIIALFDKNDTFWVLDRIE